MELPELKNPTMPIEGLTEVELAQLHCLRSIAVSLESLVLIQGLTDQKIPSTRYKTVVDLIFQHTVRSP